MAKVTIEEDDGIPWFGDGPGIIIRSVNPTREPHMNEIKFFPGDTAIINGARVEVSNTVTLKTKAPSFYREPTPGMADLPETDLRIHDLWERGHRVHMEPRQDLRCPCGSAYTRQSETHVSCLHCKRVWENKDVPSVDPE
jgi:hypothetical protein